jgi:hypothetical protein
LTSVTIWPKLTVGEQWFRTGVERLKTLLSEILWWAYRPVRSKRAPPVVQNVWRNTIKFCESKRSWALMRSTPERTSEIHTKTNSILNYLFQSLPLSLNLSLFSVIVRKRFYFFRIYINLIIISNTYRISLKIRPGFQIQVNTYFPGFTEN